ncbi:Crp/Fnr family transcriptional regulator [Aquimarina addita]|uniref:Crp/Fnr family transcriptional regulator n=1 Tax=Aquimarina addita TaxID=870485 RepID=A0ABP6UPV8_9FLAO
MNIPKEHRQLINFIANWVVLSEEEILLISSQISLEDYNKGDTIIKQEQFCTSLKFVVSGIYRVYQLKNGKEITSYFNYTTRNPLVASFISLLKQQPSTEIIECILPGQLISIPYSDWQHFYRISTSLNTFGRLLAEFNYVLAMERIESLQYQSASDRYFIFMNQYPNLFNLIPHHYIASYLGITPESLSRIRKTSFKK